MFRFLVDNLKWLDQWEKQMMQREISREEFLTQSIDEGLRVTITSTIELTKYLLKECQFKFVFNF